ncbi:FAD/NAD(P)-binding domain-containing protein [Aspergillus sclerotiicarbonarius CBS 121057]|uniref:FAD/NAD(P)-binding domain-containing protein n=1 Tax=Aspergillus sclerotiicarbonarius (strain CBS 121057 / IBT 28362) TaxID=1448318 RepID=A0A319EYG8_ASPSB|nr:FAD/NAD(P)-binding domain-containing protein [Aspergillus sclerotiicarbonarius CBS 121057]
MNTYSDRFTLPRTNTPLDGLVVGAGIGWPSSSVSQEITAVGVGIQVVPNVARILGRLGLLEVMTKANVLEMNSLQRYENDEELGRGELMSGVGERYHAPLAVIHRGDLQRILLNAVNNQTITIRTNARVVGAAPDFAAQVYTGKWVAGDVVIGADGIKSDLRHQMAAHHGVHDICQPTGDAAYRILTPKEKMQGDGHIMAYPIKNNSVYNMVLLHPQKEGAATEESWTNPGDKREMGDLLSYVPDREVMEWTLNSHFPLPIWIENRVVWMGDACHPMLPYVAQGAAQAIEDAGVLACALSLTEDLDGALAVDERVRKDRAEKIQKSAAVTRKALHLPDGDEQRKRDEAIRGPGKNPDRWADQDWQDFMWGE